MKKVVNTSGYGTSEGFVTQITLPNGKYLYTGVGSRIEGIAKQRGLTCEIVRYFGACIYCNINDRAHLKFPIQIGEVSVTDFLDKIATEKECEEFFSEVSESVSSIFVIHTS
ncbi:MAG: hypothetical protein WC842_04055 [Candidatus Paceibacterota bacterium]|jgi:hypothetical protein